MEFSLLMDPLAATALKDDGLTTPLSCSASTNAISTCFGLLSKEGTNDCTGKLLLEKALKLLGCALATRMNVQQQMNHVVSSWKSKGIYNDLLVSSPIVSMHLLGGSSFTKGVIWKDQYMVPCGLIAWSLFNGTNSFGGKKKLVLSITAWIGRKNDFLGIAYSVVGGLCFLLAQPLRLFTCGMSDAAENKMAAITNEGTPPFIGCDERSLLLANFAPSAATNPSMAKRPLILFGAGTLNASTSPNFMLTCFIHYYGFILNFDNKIFTCT